MTDKTSLTRADLLDLVAKVQAPPQVKSMAALAVSVATPKQIEEASALLISITADPDHARDKVLEAARAWGIPEAVITQLLATFRPGEKTR